MKTYEKIFLSVCALLMLSCEDNLSGVSPIETTETNAAFVKPMLILTDKQDLTTLMNCIDKGLNLSTPATRSASLAEVKSDLNGQINFQKAFVSLYDYEKQNFYSKLTQQQVDSIKNDEDSLEYCCQDSILPDEDLAQLVNVDREIQIADTIYKFIRGGIAYTTQGNANELSQIDSINQESSLSSNIQFVQIPVSKTIFDRTLLCHQKCIYHPHDFIRQHPHPSKPNSCNKL